MLFAKSGLLLYGCVDTLLRNSVNALDRDQADVKRDRSLLFPLHGHAAQMGRFAWFKTRK